jgi:hypothetical protein
MSKKLVSLVLAGILLIAFGYLAGTFSISPASAQKKIEYKVIDGTRDLQGLQSILNKMAADGWEFYSNPPNSYGMIFKR